MEGITKHKIIHVISDTNIGGAGRMLLVFLKNFNRDKYDVTVVLPEGSLLIPKIRELGVNCLEAEGIRDRSMNRKAIGGLFTILKKEEPHLVHTHAALSARLAAKLYGKCKVIHTRHSVFPQSRYKKTFPYKQLAGSMNNFLSDMMIAVSPAAKENLVETGTDANKVKVVFNGVDPVKPLSDDEKAREMARYGFTENDFVCGVIARLTKVKGHAYILKTAKMFMENNNAVRFLIAGTGPEEEALKASAKAMGLDNCLFTGFIDDIRRVEGIMKLQVNFSYGTEATSAALLEGMSLGVPAVVSDFGGNPYVIQDGLNGLVVPQKDSIALYNAIHSLYEDKERYAKMAEKSVEMFASRFTATAMTLETEKIYDKLLGS